MNCSKCGKFAKVIWSRKEYNGIYEALLIDTDCKTCGIQTSDCQECDVMLRPEIEIGGATKNSLVVYLEVGEPRIPFSLEIHLFGRSVWFALTTFPKGASND